MANMADINAIQTEAFKQLGLADKAIDLPASTDMASHPNRGPTGLFPTPRREQVAEARKAAGMTQLRPRWPFAARCAHGRVGGRQPAHAPGALGVVSDQSQQVLTARSSTHYQPAPRGLFHARNTPGFGGSKPLRGHHPAQCKHQRQHVDIHGQTLEPIDGHHPADEYCTGDHPATQLPPWGQSLCARPSNRAGSATSAREVKTHPRLHDRHRLWIRKARVVNADNAGHPRAAARAPT